MNRFLFSDLYYVIFLRGMEKEEIMTNWKIRNVKLVLIICGKKENLQINETKLMLRKSIVKFPLQIGLLSDRTVTRNETK